jgi:hypothetical protein
MRKYLLMLAAAAFLAAPRASQAYVATMNDTIVHNTDLDQNGMASIGDLFSFANASFSSYTPASGDPVIGYNNGPNDLGQYRLNVDGIVQTIGPDTSFGPNVHYGGTYFLYYDEDQSGAYTPSDYRISSGAISIDAVFNLTDGTADLNGLLNQAQGPELTPPFADLGPVVTVTGKYIPNVDGPEYGKIVNGVLSRGSAVPEPSSLGLLATGLLPLLGLRRRK